MKRFQIFCCAFFLFFSFQTHRVFALTYIPSPYQHVDTIDEAHPARPTRECQQPQVVDQTLLPPAFDQPLNQGHTATCYGHAAAYLLQDLLNQSSGAQRKISILDVLGTGCDRKYIDGGKEYSVLYHIRKKNRINFEAETEPKLEAIFNLQQDLGQLSDDRLVDRMGLVFPMLPRDGVIQMISTSPKSTLIYDAYSQLGHVSQAIPSYNIHVFEKDKKTESEIEAELIRQLQFHRPISYTGDQHELAIIGSRRLCCHSSGASPTCTTEWKLFNSYGGAKQGWHQASPLIKEMENMTTLVRCGGKDQEDCTAEILGNHPLYYMARTGDLEIVLALLDRGDDVNRANHDGMTPLFIAAEQGHVGVVRTLLDHGADVNRTLSDGITPLYIAAQEGHVDVVRALLDHGADVNCAENDGATPLCVAAQEGHVDAVRALLDHGANANHTWNHGMTPLYVAAHEGHVDVVRALLEHGADVNLARDDGTTPLFIAAIRDHIDVVRALLRP